MNSSTPPPLDFQASEYESPAKAQLAAKVGVTVPLILVLLNLFVFTPLRKASPEGLSRTAILTQGGVIVLLTVVGLAAASYALISTRKHGRRGLLGRGLAGLLINGFLLFIFTTNFIAGRQNRVATNAQMDELESSMGDIRADMKKELDEKGTIGTDGEHIKRLQKEFTKAGEKLKGPEKQMMEAAAAYAQQAQLHMQKYSAVLEDFQAAEAFSGAGITNREQLAKKRAAVEKFMKVNQSFTDFLRDAPKFFEEELRTRNLPDTELKAAMKGFNEQHSRQRPLTMEIRACDDRVGKAALGVLDLLDRQFGQWRYDTQKEQVIFNDDKALEQFNGFIDEVQ